MRPGSRQDAVTAMRRGSAARLPSVSRLPRISGRESETGNVVGIETARAGLHARFLRKAFRKRTVLRDVSLSLRRGEAVGLLGPNGAGKTTCFHLIAGLLQADAGVISVDGIDVSGLPMYRRARLGIGYLPQEASIFRGLTVEDNVRAVLQLSVATAQRLTARLESLLGAFSLTHLRRADASSLSGGERRRLEIARCLASSPRYLLLDEPFAGVDPKMVGLMREIVAHLKDRQIGVLITDHNARETFSIVDRAYVISEGQVISEGRSVDVAHDPAVRDQYLGNQFAI